ncbi:MAG: glycosyltransferase [Leptolyngbyaceae cyanobacterium SU_3_3]|nr:glycosyltransferase [Leptolyngbyaceae cyanobacterium SU_3_3]
MDSGQTLEATIFSLKCQNGVDVRIIVVDSGSQDETLSICKNGRLSHIMLILVICTKQLIMV